MRARETLEPSERERSCRHELKTAGAEARPSPSYIVNSGECRCVREESVKHYRFGAVDEDCGVGLRAYSRGFSVIPTCQPRATTTYHNKDLRYDGDKAVDSSHFVWRCYISVFNICCPQAESNRICNDKNTMQH